MHWMSVKLPDNFQMREHSWPCWFHIITDDNNYNNTLLFDFVVFFGTRFAFLHLYLQRNAMQTALPFLFTSRRQFRLSPLFTNRKINIGMDMGKNPYKQIVLALFFKMSKNMKR
jgi:hypothetical protein